MLQKKFNSSRYEVVMFPSCGDRYLLVAKRDIISHYSQEVNGGSISALAVNIIDTCKRAFIINTLDAESFAISAAAFTMIGDFNRSLFLYKLSMIISPSDSLVIRSFSRALCLCANSYRGTLAFKYAMRSVWRDDNSLYSLLNVSYALLARGRWSLAWTLIKHVVDSDISLVKEISSDSRAYLMQGSFNQGWWLNQWRSIDRFNKGAMYIANREYYESLIQPDKHLIIDCDQGIGDQILFSTTFLDLAESNLNLTILVDPRLIKIMRRSFGGIKFLSHSNSPSFDSSNELISASLLGIKYRKSINDFKRNNNRFLIPDKVKSRKLRDQYKVNGRVLCGLAWKSYNTRISKSLNLHEILNALLPTKADFICLQHGSVEDEIRFVEDVFRIKVLNSDIDLKDDLDSVFSLIAACDCIITTSNSIAHMAGAIGVRSIVITPSHYPDKIWYWFNLINGRSAWYPNASVVSFPFYNNVCDLKEFTTEAQVMFNELGKE